MKRYSRGFQLQYIPPYSVLVHPDKTLVVLSTELKIQLPEFDSQILYNCFEYNPQRYTLASTGALAVSFCITDAIA